MSKNIKSTERLALEDLVVASALDWLKCGREQLAASKLAQVVLGMGGDDDMAHRHEAHAQELYAKSRLADAESKLVSAISRLEKAIAKPSS